jgi:hypothetical protein
MPSLQQALTHAQLPISHENYVKKIVTHTYEHLKIRRRSKERYAPWSKCKPPQPCSGCTHVHDARTFKVHARSGCTHVQGARRQSESIHDNNARMHACTQVRDRSRPIALRIMGVHAHSRCTNKERSRCTHAHLNVHGTPTVYARTLLSALTHASACPYAPPSRTDVHRYGIWYGTQFYKKTTSPPELLSSTILVVSNKRIR